MSKLAFTVMALAMQLACSSTSTNEASSGGGSGGDAGSADADACPPPSPAPPCVFPHPNPGQQLFSVPFDSLAGTQAPTVGGNSWSGSVTTLTEASFGNGVCVKAAHFASNLDTLDFPEADGAGVSIIDYAKGTIALWYQPDFDPVADGAERSLFRPSNYAAHGGIRIFKVGNVLRAEARPEGAGTVATATAQVALAKCSVLKQSEWAHLAVSWAVPGAVRIFANGMLVAMSATDSSGAARTASANEKLQIGHYNGDNSMAGWIDDFRIYPNELSP